MSKSVWHHPRDEFAEQVFTILAHGPLQGISLFGPRRTGKTEFLLRDLAPRAQAEGHRVIYLSLWQSLVSPLGVLLYALDQSLRHGSTLDRARTLLTNISPRFKLKTPDGSAEVEVDLAKLAGAPPEDHLLLLDQMLEAVSDPARPTFLLLDEFQELARGRGNDALVAALRTSLDRRKDSVVAVFTGSSRAGLRTVMSGRQAPFFRFAVPMDLPELDEAFLRHQLGAFAAISNREIDSDQAAEVFDRFDRSPLFLQRWLITLAVRPDLDGVQAIDQVQDEIAEEFEFAKTWLSLTDTHRWVLRMISEPVDKIYGEQGQAFLATLGAPGDLRVQGAVKKLSGLGLIDKLEEGWRVGDPLLAAWVRRQIPVRD